MEDDIKKRKFARFFGIKTYEIKDHLGNVRSIVTDVKKPNIIANPIPALRQPRMPFMAEVLSTSEYYPFGLEMKVQSYAPIFAFASRYSYNGTHLKDNEVNGTGNFLDFGGYGLDPRIGRRWNLDPVLHEWQSDYSVFANNPIVFADPSGLDANPLDGQGGDGSSGGFWSRISGALSSAGKWTAGAINSVGNSMQSVVKATKEFAGRIYNEVSKALSSTDDNLPVYHIKGTVEVSAERPKNPVSVEEAQKDLNILEDATATILGFTNSVISDNLCLPNIDIAAFDVSDRFKANFESGEIIGHVGVILGAASEAGLGDAAIVGGAVAAPETGGVTLVVTAGGVALNAHAVAVGAVAGGKLACLMYSKNKGSGGGSKKTSSKESSNNEKKADDVINAKNRRSKSYHSDYGSKTRSELQKLADAGDQKAKQMLKLMKETNRLGQKSYGR